MNPSDIVKMARPGKFFDIKFDRPIRVAGDPEGGVRVPISGVTVEFSVIDGILKYRWRGGKTWYMAIRVLDSIEEIKEAKVSWKNAFEWLEDYLWGKTREEIVEIVMRIAYYGSASHIMHLFEDEMARSGYWSLEEDGSDA